MMLKCFTANSDVHKTTMLLMGMLRKVLVLTTTATTTAPTEFPFRFIRMEEHIAKHADRMPHKLRIYVYIQWHWNWARSNRLLAFLLSIEFYPSETSNKVVFLPYFVRHET